MFSYAKHHRRWKFFRLFSSSRRYDRVELGWLILDLVWRMFTMQASRGSVKVRFRFGSIPSSLSTALEVYLSKYLYPYVCVICMICFFSAVFLSYFSMLILSLPIIGLGSKSTFLSPGFCVSRTKQQEAIFMKWNLICWFFAFFLWIVLLDGINKCGSCLAGGRGCWHKGPHKISSVSWIFHHSLHSYIY